MAEILDKLEREHANIAGLLDVFERQLVAFAEAAPVDYDLILEIVDYFLDYPDRVHHPKEDLIYRKLRRRDRALAAQIGDLEAEHREVAALTRELAETVRALMLNADVSREDVLGAARAFIEYQRRHLEMERTTFFPAALEALSEADWSEIDAAARDRPDPLIDGETAQRYERLREDILRWESEE